MKYIISYIKKSFKKAMAGECASCGADDELLFTCSYCDEQFCSSHQFPHHACEGFGRPGETGNRSDADDWLPASALGDGPEPREAVSAGDDPGEVTGVDASADDKASARPVTVTPAEPSARAESLSAGGWNGSGSPPVRTGDGVVNVRPMDSRRVVGGTEASAAPRTVGDWISRQTYLTLLVKVGVIALLVNAAFYGGMAVTLYGVLPFAL